MHRLYHPGPLSPNTTVVLEAAASHHTVEVLRLRQGATVELFNGSGQRYRASIEDAHPRRMTVRVDTPTTATTESPLRLGLAQALPLGDKMDWIIEKATELGVRMIQPIFSAKSLIKLDSERAERRRNHWQRIAIAACMQCGRDHIPDIAMPIALSHWLQKAPATPSAFLPSWLPHEAVPPGPPPDAALRLFLSPHQARPFSALPDLQPNIQSIWLLSGPEGGWSSAEQTAAHAAGWEAVQLGPRILRTETAGPAALAALQARWGDF